MLVINLMPGQQMQKFRKESLDKVLIRSQYHNTSIQTHKLLKRRVVGVAGGSYGQIGLFKDKLLFKNKAYCTEAAVSSVAWQPMVFDTLVFL